MSLIESAHNAKFKSWMGLLEAKGIKKQRQALISGRRLVEEFLENSPKSARDLILPEKMGMPTLASHIRVHKLGGSLFSKLDVFGTRWPLLVVEVPALPDWKPTVKPSGLELIVALSDPGNLGTLLRSAEAFGVNRVILTQECSSPFLPKVIRASSGSVFRMNLARTGSIDRLEPVQGGHSLDMNGVEIQKFAWPKNVYLVLGEEGQGVPESLNLKRIAIPMQGKTESLNAPTAAAIAMFSYQLKHGTK
jgi:TrmH family RNA methyltransferase